MKKEQMLPIITGLLGLIGLSVSVYLSYKQISGTPIGNCPVFGGGCTDVLHSKYSQFLGVPLAYYGVLFYSGIVCLSLLFATTKKVVFKYLLALGAIVGFIDSIIFISIQAFLIGAYCFYCIISGATSTLLFFTMLGTIIDKILDFFEHNENSEQKNLQ